jgi:hypothetical protein
VFSLHYVEHGGSGIGMTLAEILELDLGEQPGGFDWWLARLDERRTQEAKAMRAPMRSGKRR